MSGPRGTLGFRKTRSVADGFEIESVGRDGLARIGTGFAQPGGDELAYDAADHAVQEAIPGNFENGFVPPFTRDEPAQPAEG